MEANNELQFVCNYTEEMHDPHRERMNGKKAIND